MTVAVLGVFVRFIALELALPLKGGGTAKMRRTANRQGLERDECFWLEHERAMRGKQKWKASRNPPPDLAIEMDVPQRSLSRMAIYAALRVPEVWRCTRKALRVFRLDAKGHYQALDASALWPFVPLERVFEFLQNSGDNDETTLLREFTTWVCAEVLPRYEAWRQRSKKNGK